MNNFQRVGSVSNAHVGRDFENAAIKALSSNGITVTQDFPVKVGVATIKKSHTFDLGHRNPPVIVECKSHRWTSGGNVPSAKMTVWNEAMYYFSCAPTNYRKILFVLRDVRSKTGETLAEYYMRTYPHLVPPGVELWEYDEVTEKTSIIKPPHGIVL